jgi:hypothetical protein
MGSPQSQLTLRGASRSGRSARQRRPGVRRAGTEHETVLFQATSDPFAHRIRDNDFHLPQKMQVSKDCNSMLLLEPNTKVSYLPYHLSSAAPEYLTLEMRAETALPAFLETLAAFFTTGLATGLGAGLGAGFGAGLGAVFFGATFGTVFFAVLTGVLTAVLAGAGNTLLRNESRPVDIVATKRRLAKARLSVKEGRTNGSPL